MSVFGSRPKLQWRALDQRQAAGGDSGGMRSTERRKLGSRQGDDLRRPGSWRRRVTFVLAVVALLAVLGIAAATLTYVAPLDSFQRGPDDRHLIVQARLNTGDSILLPLTREGQEEIVVVIVARRDLGLKEGFAILTPVTIELREPLSARRVVAPSGVPVRERPK